MRLIRITGIKQIKANMKKASSMFSSKLSRNLRLAGIFVLRESQKIVPVHQGNLKASGGVRNVGGSGFYTDIVVFYNAEYAVYVHEDLNKLHGAAFNIAYAEEIANATTPAQKAYYFNRGENQRAKFLESVVREKRHEIFQIIARA